MYKRVAVNDVKFGLFILNTFISIALDTYRLLIHLYCLYIDIILHY